MYIFLGQLKNKKKRYMVCPAFEEQVVYVVISTGHIYS